MADHAQDPDKLPSMVSCSRAGVMHSGVLSQSLEPNPLHLWSLWAPRGTQKEERLRERARAKERRREREREKGGGADQTSTLMSGILTVMQAHAQMPAQLHVPLCPSRSRPQDNSAWLTMHKTQTAAAACMQIPTAGTPSSFFPRCPLYIT